MPNEQDIIMDTLNHYNNMKCDNLQVVLAYNTNKDLPIEKNLREFKFNKHDFLLLRVPNSTSKADNVNYAVSQCSGEIIGIYDTDHYPSDNVFDIASYDVDNGYDIIQGRCNIRNGDTNLLTKIVSVEFEIIYGLSHTGRSYMFNYALFGGSNGYWKKNILERVLMDKSMLTEDIDSTFRSILLGNYKINYNPDIISTELAPTAFSIYYKQRLRWAQGWFQVSKKYIKYALTCPYISLRQRIGLIFIFSFREMFFHISNQIFPLLLVYYYKTLIYGYKYSVDIPGFVTTIFCLANVFFVFSIVNIIAMENIKKGWTFLFFLFSPFYIYLQNYFGIIGQVRELVKYKKWNVTSRK
jgi:cellulose synthase/poly-beta-1,6-N-acetylglucosamine synthase-like glycosyltransferase